MRQNLENSTEKSCYTVIMKTCNKCESDKPEEEFSWKSKNAGTRNSWCRECMKGYDRTRYLTTDRPKQARASAKKNKSRLRSAVLPFLQVGCTDCGNTDIRVLQFDHRDPKLKSMNVSTMVNIGKALDDILLEIAKCDVRCANCHQIRTGTQFGWWSS